jgi:hypothetical protein
LGGLTRDQLRWIFSSYPQLKLEVTGWNPAALKNSDGDDETHLWNELDSRCEATEILISGPDTLRGSLYYMEETILTDYQNGEYFDFSRRPNGYFNSANDDDLVEYILKNDAALSYFDFSYYTENKDSLYPVPIQNSQGQFVTPSLVSVKTGQYEPLSRRVYVNLHKDDESLAMTAPFIKFGMSDLGLKLVETAGLAPLSASEQEAAMKILYAALGQETPKDGPQPASIATIVIVCLVVVSILAFVVIRKTKTGKEADSGEDTDTTASPYSESRTNWAEQDPETETAQKEVV